MYTVEPEGHFSCPTAKFYLSVNWVTCQMPLTIATSPLAIMGACNIDVCIKVL